MIRINSHRFVMAAVLLPLLGFSHIRADLLAYENFDYTLNDTTLSGENGGGGWSGAWSLTGATGGDTGIRAGWNVTGITSSGNAWRMDNYVSGTVSRSLSNPIGIVGGNATHSEIWVSALLLHANTSFDYEFKLRDSGTSSDVLTIQGGADGGTTPANALKATVDGTTFSSGVVSVPSVAYSYDDPNVVLMKMQFSPSNMTTVDAWVFDIGDSIPQTEGTLPSASTQNFQWTNVTDFSFDQVTFGGYSFQPSQIDEIRVATTLDDALNGTTVIPEPSTMLLLLLGGAAFLALRRRPRR